MKNIPERIYIQIDPEEESWEEETDFQEIVREYGDEITWCRDRINGTDIEYIHIDKYNILKDALRTIYQNRKRVKGRDWEREIIKKAMDLVKNPDKFRKPDSMEL